MVERSTLLVLCCLAMQAAGSSCLYPGLRFGQKGSSSFTPMSSSGENGSRLPCGTAPQRDGAEKRTGRHADAIFTNSYRKVLGQLSARRFLQTIMGKRLSQWGAEVENAAKRQTSVFTDTYRQDLTAVQHYRRQLGAVGPR
ncbi:VIP protein, partial [Atractosteus spatula]|nr:VIP protein [Atractosteus spatula]